MDLVGVGALEEGHEHDLEVEEEAPIFHVPEVVFDAFGEVGVTAQAVDLGPAGHAGFGMVAGVVVGDVVFEVLDEFGAFGAGADEAHFPFEDVPELGDFVDVVFTHEGADAEAAGVVFLAPLGAFAGFGVEFHGTDFEDVEGFADDAGAALAVEDGTAGFEPDEGAEEGDDGGGEEEADEAADDVGGAFDGPVEGAIEGEAIDAEDGGAGDGFEVKTGDEDAEAGGDDFELDEFAFAEGGEAGEFVALSVEVGDDDHVDFVTSEEALDLRERAEVRGAILVGGFFEGGICGGDHADDAEG